MKTQSAIKKDVWDFSYTLVKPLPVTVGIGNSGGAYISYMIDDHWNIVLNWGINQDSGKIFCGWWSGEQDTLVYTGWFKDISGNFVNVYSDRTNTDISAGLTKLYEDASLNGNFSTNVNTFDNMTISTGELYISNNLSNAYIYTKYFLTTNTTSVMATMQLKYLYRNGRTWDIENQA